MMHKKNDIRNHQAPWTLGEINYMESHYGELSAAEIGKHLGRTVAAVKGMARKLGCCAKKTPDWSEADKEFLRSTYGSALDVQNIFLLLPGRSLTSVVLMARKLGLKRPEPFWQDAELSILAKYYPTEGKKVAVRLPARSEESVKIKASKLGLRFHGHGNYRIWTEEERALLAKNHHLPFSLLCKFFPNRSQKSVEFALGKYRQGLKRQR
ncbi:hypothetical protein MUA04_03260 [Enterobacteriaceae bacterium H11S18]|uniref:hypothetical protein n=1 Tax=Dryocola clanedunensis TaxID=2925396 RepID=UPI0022F06108|nr:hypothetical protein [Dryocola clanedunensis]MCT4709214.1 hypothetical protein [Dryocola clanedunensis]